MQGFFTKTGLIERVPQSRICSDYPNLITLLKGWRLGSGLLNTDRLPKSRPTEGAITARTRVRSPQQAASRAPEALHRLLGRPLVPQTPQAKAPPSKSPRSLSSSSRPRPLSCRQSNHPPGAGESRTSAGRWRPVSAAG